MKLIKKDLKVINLILILISITLLPRITSASVYFTATYWSTCWKEVYAEEFIGSAKSDIEEIRIVHNLEYHVPVMNQDNANTNDKINVIQKSTESLIATLNQAYQSLSEARTT